MGWPKGMPRKKKELISVELGLMTLDEFEKRFTKETLEEKTAFDKACYEAIMDPVEKGIIEGIRQLQEPPKEEVATVEPLKSEYPAGWAKGALLNVRNKGEYYAVTLFPEEEDFRCPERTLKFRNTAETQDFISRWYQRESADPRAFR